MNTQALKELLEKRNQRERWLIVVTLMVFIYFIVDILAFKPLMTSLKTQQTIIATKKQTLAAQQEQRAQEDVITKHNQESVSKKLELLKEEIEQHKRLVQSSLMGENAVEFLAALMKDSTLVQSISTQSPQEVEHFESLYRHTIDLLLEGSYNEVAAFVQAIEQLPVPIAIDKFQYQVAQHPKASVQVSLTYLSSNPNLARLAP